MKLERWNFRDQLEREGSTDTKVPSGINTQPPGHLTFAKACIALSLCACRGCSLPSGSMSEGVKETWLCCVYFELREVRFLFHLHYGSDCFIYYF